MLLRLRNEPEPRWVFPVPLPLETSYPSFAVLSEVLIRTLESRIARPRGPLLPDGVGICPPDVLALFAPERRLAVLTEGPDRKDWIRAAAVRAAGIFFGTARLSGRTLAQWDSQIREMGDHFLTLECTGLPAFIRHGLDGQDDAEQFLKQRTVWNGFELTETLGRGGTSLAFRALKNGCSCVLKVPLSGRTRRFRREVRLLKHVRHRNLPDLSESSTGTRPYCVMESFRASGGDPAGFRNALDYLHERRILHGDIRRSNLGYRADGTAVLFDLSHARRARTRTEAEKEMNELDQLLKKEYAK